MNVLQLLEFQLILSCIFTFLPKIALWGILCFHQKPRECALPRQVADAASLEVFKTKLDGTLGNLISWKVSLPMTGGLELGGL